MVFLFLSGWLSAQQLSVKSFRKLENDLSARGSEGRTDQNGDKCAIIKIVTTETGFVFEPDALGMAGSVQKTGEVWLYVPYGAKRLTVNHPQLGVLRNYVYPKSIDQACVYELVLEAGWVEPKQNALKYQWAENVTLNQKRVLGKLINNMVKVEGGSFKMGRLDWLEGVEGCEDEYPVHKVVLSDYFIGKYEVTQEEWEAVMGYNPACVKEKNLPVEWVSWEDCLKFIVKLNGLTGLKFQLPTEAQWEFAARGGNLNKGYVYAGSNRLNDVAWYWQNSGDEYFDSGENINEKREKGNCRSHPVGQKLPNELGLYDMSGNVAEWCYDRYGKYPKRTVTNPKGPSRGDKRVSRNGDWCSLWSTCRISCRGWNFPDERQSTLGFRLVCLPST